MQVKDKVYCNLDFLHVVTEKTLKNADGSFKTLSIMRGKEYEMMIFLGRKSRKSDYFVRVYKCEPKKVFVRHFSDSFRRCEMRPHYDVFFFEDLDSAKDFIKNLSCNHREYEKRPITIA